MRPDQIELLAKTFPSLFSMQILEADGTFNPRVFLDRVYLSGAGSGACHAARFVARVWEGGNCSGFAFDVVAALGAWDKAHRVAFLTWANEIR